MSDINRLFEAIESQQFSTLVNVASDPKTFVRAVKAQAGFQQLTAQLQSCGPQRVVERVRQLVESKPEPNVEHPHDAALAAYVLALQDCSPDDSVDAARVILDQGEGCWWARKMSEEVCALAEAGNRL